MTKLATSLKKRELGETFMREAILAAAKRVLATHTYDRTSLDQIAAEAQVSKGSIYAYFPSKEALLWEVLKDGLERFIAAGKEAAHDAPTPLGKLHALVRAHLEFLAADVDGFKIALAERTNLILNPRGHEIQTLWRMYQEYADWVGDILQQAAKAEEIRPVPGRRYALLLLDMALMVMYQRLAVQSNAPLAQEADEILELFLRGLSVQARAPTKRLR